MKWRAQGLKLLSALLPKFNTAAVHTWPSFDDTALAIIPGLEQSSVRRIYYLAASDVTSGRLPAWGSKVTILPKRSLRALWVFLTSRYVFFTHQCFTMQFPRRVVSVNLWHGMLIKRLGWMLPGDARPRARYDLATSAFWAPIIQACMRPWDKVLINGLPRCDRLGAFSREEVLERIGGDTAGIERIAVWLPTYRQSVRGDIRADGADFNNVAQVPGFDADRFEEWLADHHTVCILKPHPLGPRPELRLRGHLRILDDAALAAQGLSLYGLLGATDVLLTDLSSVYVDFLALNRPVIHAFADRKAFADGRGFTFEWNDDHLAGPIVTDMAGVEQALEDLLAGRDAAKEKRARLRQLFHADPEASATKSLLEQLGLGATDSASME